MKPDAAFPLRAHHGLCLMFFEGKGYSPAFTQNMAQILNRLEKAPGQKVRLLAGGDRICAPCPHFAGGKCAENAKTSAFDRRALALCGLFSGSVLPWEAYRDLLQNRIIASKKLAAVCAGCQWSEICQK